MYSIFIHNNFITEVRGASGGEPVSQEMYETIVQKFLNRPVAPDGFAYKLRADTLEWELVELPPMPEPKSTIEDKAEAYDILIGGTE